MAQPYIGEIRIFAGNFAPAGWALCDGSPMPIAENEALFQLLGTTYGGDGESEFNLPNMQSRIPVHMGTGPDGTTYNIGEMAGVETVTLSVQQIPNHNHVPIGSLNPASQQSPAGAVLANATSPTVGILTYGSDTPFVPMNGGSITPTGGSQPHDNTQPFLVLNFIISLFGIYPSPT
jgi:microcystin-dependent protein